ncbi:MAG: EamA family transporter [Rhodospirillales bacterium]|jgi:drug/metabolite transporter (DMT)-like permease|nr:EamA family transporter [Rhodospirillales bacterium]
MRRLSLSLGSILNGTPSTLRGMAFMLLSALMLTGVNALIREMSSELHPFEIAFFRNLFGFIVLLPVFWRRGLQPLRTGRLGLHAVRGIVHTTSSLMFFYALSITPLAKATALKFSAPLFGTLLALMILGEALRARRITALVIGFAGTWVILRPGIADVDLGSLLVLGSAAIFATAMVIIKVLSRTESSLTITLYMGVFLSPLTLIAALPYWQMPSLEQLLWFAFMGAIGSIGQMCLAQAFKEADATAVFPFDFTKLLWAAVIGYFLFGEIPDAWTWLGGTMIFSAVAYIAYRENSIRTARKSPSQSQDRTS